MQIVRCGRCRMMYQNPRVDETAMGDAYEVLAGYRRFSAQDAAKQALFTARIERLRRDRALPERGSFLDVGAARGIMLGCVSSALPDWRLSAVELSPSARARLTRVGYKCAASIADLDPRVKFDWINIDNVLEHLPDPLGVLLDLKLRLKPGGFIYVEVPNESFLQFRYRVNDAIRGYSKLPTAEGHVNLFTPGTLRRLFHAAGFRCEDFHLESVAVPHRLKGALGGDETLLIRRVFRFLRLTRLDLATRLAYFICARIELA
ncbi:MAG TPA: class I SAM-dependent methyltransferase [Bryobacteraceae bacterium]